jgi:hypothetical protein
VIAREIPLFPGLRLRTTSDWYVEVVDLTWNGIVQWRFVDKRNDYVYGAPIEWVYRAWSLA